MIQQGREYLSDLLLFCITQDNIYFFSYAFTVQFVVQICDIMFNIGDAKQISHTYSLPSSCQLQVQSRFYLPSPCQSEVQSSYYLAPDSRYFLSMSLLNHSWNSDQNQNLLENLFFHLHVESEVQSRFYLSSSLLNHSQNSDQNQNLHESIYVISTLHLRC